MIPLLVSAHRDPTQFKDPDQFNPTNFLDAQGQFQNNDAFMPFAPGLGQEGGTRVATAGGLAGGAHSPHTCTHLHRKADVPGCWPGPL